MRKYRIGIDVGGTFTHAVAIRAGSTELEGSTKVPTTHQSRQGVSEGVVESVRSLMDKLGISPEDVVYVAHSTTQATNSLLEGDVAPVGVLTCGEGFQGRMAKSAGELESIPLTETRELKLHAYHCDFSNPHYESELDKYFNKLLSQNVKVLVVASSFSIDDPTDENHLAELAEKKGFLVCKTHEISKLYGLKIRIRTTAINASILPKMLEVAEQTERGIRALGISSPLMVMRSDGGVMSLEEMRKKPVLTLLSGPAAGIAAALRYLRVSDGIFIEVGGTSTDISVIQGGKAVTRSARIGGRKTFLRTLDCRTLGVGGGSIPRYHGGKVIDVGPRSAHIAKASYAAFEHVESHEAVKDIERKLIAPLEGDPSDYLLWVHHQQGKAVAWTPTCSANLLGYVPQNDPAKSLSTFPGEIAKVIAANLHVNLKDFSKQVLETAADKIESTVEGLIKEYQLDKDLITLVGGGGGASVYVPYLAKKMGMRFEIAKHSDVISAIGVALGLLRESVEKSIVNPSPEDLLRIREEARAKLLDQGADPSTIEVFLDVDQRKGVVRADAQGAIEFQGALETPHAVSEAEVVKMAAESIGVTINQLLKSESTSVLRALSFQQEVKSYLGFIKRNKKRIIICDKRGVVRMKLRNGNIYATSVEHGLNKLSELIEKETVFGDGGIGLPSVYALVSDRVVDLSRLSSQDQMKAVLETELREIPRSEALVLVSGQKALGEDQ